MLQRRGSAKEKHEARVAWIREHPQLLVGVPGIHDDVTDQNRIALDALRQRMHAEGLFGRGTYTAHREIVRRLATELRGGSIGGGW
jgi:hypothetical protein